MPKKWQILANSVPHVTLLYVLVIVWSNQICIGGWVSNLASSWVKLKVDESSVPDIFDTVSKVWRTCPPVRQKGQSVSGRWRSPWVCSTDKLRPCHWQEGPGKNNPSLVGIPFWYYFYLESCPIQIWRWYNNICTQEALKNDFIDMNFSTKTTTILR